MWRRSIVLPCALLALGSAGLPQENATGIPGANAVLARQAGMDMSLLTIRSIEASIKAGGEAKSQGFPAAVLAKWAKGLPPMFPAGTAKGETSVETQALPALSKDHAGFERAAAYYAAAAARLSELAAANDTAGFTKQLDKVNEACNACHATYKQTPPAGHGK
jgi:cytochrome c556